jgi:hypothetical protein
VPTAFGRHYTAKCRAFHPTYSFEGEDGSRQDRAAVPGRNGGGCPTVANQLVRQSNAVTRLGTNGLRRVFIHTNDLVSVHDLQIKASGILACKLRLDGALRPNQENADSKLARRLYGASHNLTRRIVSTHSI